MSVQRPVIETDGFVCQVAGRTTLDIGRLAITRGERIAIVGANGAGKSTLVRTLTGFVLPTRGAVDVLGRRISVRSHRRELRSLRGEVGQVLQGLHLVQRLSALENVLIGALGRLPGWRSWARCYHERDVSDAENALRDVGLLAKADERADRLSGGERQKVAIARMLMQRPTLILADEPTASLDPLAAAEICRLLADTAKGATLISVVHNPSLLPMLAERVLGLKHGRIAFDLPLSALDDRQLARLYRPDACSVLAPVPHARVEAHRDEVDR
jgi:phosphonate transport system ATP-binding protein